MQHVVLKPSAELLAQIQTGYQLKKMPEPQVQREVVVMAPLEVMPLVDAPTPAQAPIQTQAKHPAEIGNVELTMLKIAGFTALLTLADEVAGLPGVIAVLGAIELGTRAAQYTGYMSGGSCARAWNTTTAAAGAAISGLLQGSPVLVTFGTLAAVARMAHHGQNDHGKAREHNVRPQ